MKSAFTPETVGDPTKDAVLRDNADFLWAIDAGIVAQNPDYKPLAFYMGEEAAASTHDDESKAYSKVIKTGKLQGTEVTKDSYVIYNTLLRKDKTNDVWKTVKIISTRGAKECQP